MISKNEHEMVSLVHKGVEIGLITANQAETVFYLYEPVGNDYRKLWKSDNPLELERRLRIARKMEVKP